MISFDTNSYKSKIKKRSTTKKLRNGLESLRDAKINKKLETLKKKQVSYKGAGVYPRWRRYRRPRTPAGGGTATPVPLACGQVGGLNG